MIMHRLATTGLDAPDYHLATVASGDGLAAFVTGDIACFPVDARDDDVFDLHG